MRTKLKRALFGVMAGIMVANTPLTTLAAYTPANEPDDTTSHSAETASDKEAKKDQEEKSILEQKDLYTYLGKMEEEDRKKILADLTDEQTYELVILLQYEYLDTFNQEQSLELYKETVDGYWKNIPELKTDEEKKEYESKLSDWQDTAFKYVDTEEKDASAYEKSLYKEKEYAKDLYQILKSYVEEKDDAEKQAESEEAYESLKAQIFSGGGINQDTSTDKKETPDSKDETSDTVVDDKESDTAAEDTKSEGTGNSEGTESLYKNNAFAKKSELGTTVKSDLFLYIHPLYDYLDSISAKDRETLYNGLSLNELYQFILVLQFNYLETFSANQTPVVYEEAVKYYYDRLSDSSEEEQNNLMEKISLLQNDVTKYFKSKKTYAAYLQSICEATDYDSEKLYAILSKYFNQKTYSEFEDEYYNLKIDSYTQEEFDSLIATQASSEDSVAYVYTNSEFLSALEDTRITQINIANDITFSAGRKIITRSLKIRTDFDCDETIYFKGKSQIQVSGSGNTLTLCGDSYGILTCDFTDAKEPSENGAEGACIEASVGSKLIIDYVTFQNVKAQSTGAPAWTVHGTGCGDVTITNCKFKNVTCGIGIVGNYNENIESDTIIAVKKCSFTGTSNSSSDRRYNNTAILINNSNRLYNAVIENNTVNGMGYFFVFANESYASSWFDPYGKGCYARTKNNTINNAYFQAVYVDNMCGKKYQEMYSYTSENDKILQTGEEGYSLNNTMGYLKASSTSNGYVKNCTKRGVALSGAVVDVSGIDITQNKGGGVSTDNNSTLKLRSGRIYDNDVAGNGGGLLNNGITDIYDFFRIKENTATGNGEGIYQNGGLTLHDSVTIDTSNDIYLAADKIINMDATVDSISSFTGRITPSQYTPGRICVYAVNDNINGSYLGDSFTLTPKSPYLLRGGNLINGITTYKKDYKLLISRTYDITYDANGGTNAPAVQKKYWKENTTLSTKIPTKNSYLFSGWNTEEDGSGDDYFPGDTYSENEALYLYAQWTPIKYTVAYNGNGSTSGSMLTQTFTYGKSYNLAANGFVRSNYHFAGWNTKADGSGTSYADKQSVKNLASTHGAKITLYAQWVKSTYTICFHANGGIGSMANVTVPYDTSYNLPTNKFTYQGYTFDKWKTEDGTSVYGNEAAIKYSSSQLKNGVLNLYAQWKINQYTLTITGDSGVEKITGSGTYNYGTTANVTYQIKPGYHIKNITGTTADGDPNGVWTGHTGKGGTVNDTWTVKVCNRTIVVHTEPNTYTVKYDGNGNTGGSTASSNHTYGTAKALTANGYTKTGYSFNGWNTKADGSGTAYADKASVKNLTTANGGSVTLYAQWAKNSYYLDLNGRLDGKSTGNITGYGTADIYVDGVQKANDVTDFYQKIPYGSKYEIKDIKTVTGHTYVGVHSGSITGTIGTSNVGVVLEFKTNKYTVTFDKNNGTGTMADQTFTYGVKQALTKNAFTRTGYTFKNWNTQADGKGTAYTDQQEVTSLSAADGATIRLYAQWTANKYTVAYNANGGSGTMATDKATYGAGYVTKANAFSRTGYTFVGWNEKADGTGTDWTSWIGKSWTWTYTKNITLYAQWTKNSYYLDLNGLLDGKSTGNITGYGTADIYVDGVQKANDVTDFYQKIPYGSKYEIKDIKVVTGHTYVGVHSGSITGTIGTSNVGVVLEFKTNKYTVTFDKNNGTGTMKDQTFTYGVKQALTVNAFSRTGYTFTGWNTKADGSGTTYTDKQEVTSLTAADGATITLYAQWKINSYTLTYDPNGGSVTPTSKTLTYGSQYGALPTPSRTGYTFTGWFTAASGGSKVGTATTMGAGNTTVYAHWRANVLTVNYYPNGATKVDTSSAADGSAVSTIDSSAKYRSDTFNYDASLPSYGLWDARRFIRTGYTSTNKYHANSVTGTILLDAGNNVYTKTQDLASAVGKLLELEKGDVTISIYADWKANAYTVKYNGNGNTGGSTAGSSHTYDTAKGLTANGFTKTGYTFKNWNTKADGSGTSYADKASVKNLTATNGATVTLYAQWTANKYTVTYNANGGSGTMANQELTYNKAAILNANTFKRTGYRFNGWNTKADGTGTSYADKASVKNLTANSGGTVTLYAKWYSAAPELEAKDATYYEGQDITKAMLLKNVTKASDVEDGDMVGKVIITKIEYSAGKLVDGKPQAAYTKSWTNGMPDSEKLDTWFQQLPKEKAPVTHKITYQVTDLSGKTTTKTSTITVKYNEFPVIKAEDRYFTLEEAKSGKITKDVLLKEAIASGKLKAEDKEDGVISNKVTILDYKDTDFKNVNGNATVTVIFKVNDSMGPSGVGKETVCEVKVKIIDSGSDYWRDDDGTARKQVRFITQKYYDKNKDTDFHGMTSEEIEASSNNGGLNVMSKWYQNAAYKALLTGSFAKDAGTDYKISAEKAKELKQKIESNGIGNSKSSNALTDIYNSLK